MKVEQPHLFNGRNPLLIGSMVLTLDIGVDGFIQMDSRNPLLIGSMVLTSSLSTTAARFSACRNPLLIGSMVLTNKIFPDTEKTKIVAIPS